MNLEFAPADEARAERMGGYVARAYGCNVKPQADAPLNLCVDCGMPIERVKHSRRERCVDCSRITNAADSRAIKQAIRDGSLVNPDSICPACQCRIKDHRSGLCYVCRGKQR